MRIAETMEIFAAQGAINPASRDARMATLHRANNLNTVDDPEIYEVVDGKGKRLARFRDRESAEKFLSTLKRKAIGLGKPPGVVRKAQRFKDRDTYRVDDSLRNTTGGTGGTGGPGNG